MFDPVKNDRDIQERGLVFMLMSEMDWATAYIGEDQRKDYGERRFRVSGCINDRLSAAAFNPRAHKLHVISLRKGNSREVKVYEKTLDS